MAMLVVGQLNAQNKPQIFINNIEEKYCAGQTIPFTISTNLKEKVEFNILISDYSGRSFESLKTTQKLNDSIVLPSDVILGGRYVFKVVVETLGVESDESTPFSLFEIPKARLVTTKTELQNPFSQSLIKFDVKALGEYLVQFSNGQVFRNSQNESEYIGNQLSINVSEPQTLKIDKVSNFCGSNEGTGQTEIKVNDYGIRLKALEEFQNACPGSPVFFQISDNKSNELEPEYEVIITQESISYERVVQVKRKNNGLFYFDVPSDIKTSFGYTYRLNGVNNTVLSNKASFFIQPKPNVQLIAEEPFYSEQVYFQLRANGGTPPYSIEFEGYDFLGVSSRTFQFPIFEKESKTYKYSVFDRCGLIIEDQIDVEVDPFIEPLGLIKESYCAGETIKIPINTNLTEANGTSFFIELFTSFDGFSSQRQQRVPASLNNGTLEAVIPQLSGDFYRITLQTRNPSANSKTGLGRWIKINKPGVAQIDNRGDTTLVLNLINAIEPNFLEIDINDEASDIDFYDFAFEQNNRSSKVYTLDIRPTEKSVFVLKRATNECGEFQVRDGNDKATFEGRNGRQIKLAKFNQSTVCVGESIDFQYSIVNGDLKEQEEVELWQTVNQGTWSRKIGASKNGKISWIVNASILGPKVQVFVKISGTDIKSSSRGIVVKDKPQITTIINSGRYSDEGVVLEGEEIDVLVASDGGLPVTFDFLGQSLIFDNNNFEHKNSASQVFNFKLFENTSFKIENITNECGEGVANQLQEEIFVKNTILEPNNDIQACQEDYFKVNYNTVGKVPEKINLIAFNESKEFLFQNNLEIGPGLIVVKNENLPNSPVFGNYSLFQSDDTNDIPSSLSKRFVSFQYPRVTLIGDNGGSEAFFSPFTGFNLSGVFEGSESWTINSLGFNIVGNNSFSSSPSVIKTDIDSSGTYKLSEIQNYCGYGETMGEVKVDVAPFIKNIDGSDVVCDSRMVDFHFELGGSVSISDSIEVFIESFDDQEESLLRIAIKSLNQKFTFNKPSTWLGERVSFQFKIVGNEMYEFIKTVLFQSSAKAFTSGGQLLEGQSSISIPMQYSGSFPVQMRFSYEPNRLYRFNKRQDLNSFKTTIPTARTISIINVENSCGVGIANGIHELYENLEGAKFTQVVGFDRSAYCQNDTITIDYKSNNLNLIKSSFGIRLNNERGESVLVEDFLVFNSEKIGIVVPQGFFGQNVVAVIIYNEESIVQIPSSESIQIGFKPSAEIINVIFNENNVKIDLSFGGSSPWFVFGVNDLNEELFKYEFDQNTTTINYNYIRSETFLLSVQNSCGTIELTNSPILVEVLTGIEDVKMSKIFPNPTRGNFEVHSEGKPFKIFDIKGSLISEYSGVKEIQRVEFKDKPAGVYVIQFSTGETTKLIKD